MKKQLPKLLISTYGGHRLGTGHIFRDLEVAKLLVGKMRISYQVDGSGGAGKIFKQRGVKHILAGNLKKSAAGLGPDMILYDKPYALGPIKDIEPYKGKILALDYFFYNDRRINAAVNIMNHYYLSSHKINRLFDGVQYAIVRDEIIRLRRDRKTIARKVRNVLITFGGADPRNNTRRAIDILNSLSGQRLNITIILGYIFRKDLELAALKRLTNGPHKYTVKNKVMNMADLMAQTDLAFCGAGTTMMELLTIGCPVIVLPQNQQEADLAKKLERKGALLLMDHSIPLNIAGKRTASLLLDHPARKKLADIGRRLFDGRGKQRIRNIILKELKSAA
jgi:spore coat polysaccharide biosynthesis predicted glycosyltransferase SpsG